MEIKVKDYKTGEVIKIIREWTELSQSEFAQSIHKSLSTVQSYETSRRKYTLDTLNEIAKEYDLEIIIRKKKVSNK